MKSARRAWSGAHSPVPDDPDEIARRLAVSRETASKLVRYVEELRRWQRVRNLVAPSTLSEVWGRHIADSLQLADLASGRVWVDLGSGAGLPGIPLALARPEITMHLVESDGRKVAFLRHAGRLLTPNVVVWDGRIETVLEKIAPKPNVVVSRALAALPKLLTLSASLLSGGAIGLFPKGRGYQSELTEARGCWRFACDVVPSRTDPDGRILRISDLGGLSPAEDNLAAIRDEDRAGRADRPSALGPTARSRPREPKGRGRKDNDSD